MSNSLWSRSAVVAAVASFAVSFVAVASADGPPPLPAEAYTACESKSSGDACSVQIRDRTIEGTCTAHPSDQRLFCRPSGPPPGPRPDDKGNH